MKIIDNRYKIESILVGKINYESYLISDLWEDNKSQYMKLYNYDNHKELINYFIDSFIILKILNKYKSTLKSHFYIESFFSQNKLINSIDK